MSRYLVIFSLVLLALSVPAHAEEIQYYQDPVFKRTIKDEPHPMEDIITLAEEGDGLAQFILGDLHAKGKGGYPKNEKEGAAWFEVAAKSGYHAGFFRLAAIAKRKGDFVAAYKWYTLALDKFSFGKERSFAAKEREALVSGKKLGEDDIEKARAAAREWEARKKIVAPSVRKSIAARWKSVIEEKKEKMTSEKENTRHEQN